MKQATLILATVVTTLCVGALLAQQAAPVAATPRFSAEPLNDGGQLGFIIVDHQANMLHIYLEEEDAYLGHQGAVDLTKAGKQRIDYTSAPEE